jgi:acetamidase/formamidase
MTRHDFRPTHYFTTIGAHAPVLHIADGDTVVTATVDAGGTDEHGRRVTPRGNPMTGPFYIAGAEPGDALAVTIERLMPTRPTGWTAAMVAPQVVDPSFRPTPSEGETVTWTIDRAAGTVALADPPAALQELVLPLDPMIGCFGVAPAGGQALSTATSGEHGGNMDYRGFRPGVTALFPVFVPGALFFLGDGHARQGDGEIVGTGIETSFEMEFTVHLRRGWPIQWPRGEDDEAIFTVGNARPLEQAVQQATTEMLRWLAADYGLDRHRGQSAPRPGGALRRRQRLRPGLHHGLPPRQTLARLGGARRPRGGPRLGPRLSPAGCEPGPHDLRRVGDALTSTLVSPLHGLRSGWSSTETRSRSFPRPRPLSRTKHPSPLYSHPCSGGDNAHSLHLRAPRCCRTNGRFWDKGWLASRVSPVERSAGPPHPLPTRPTK